MSIISKYIEIGSGDYRATVEYVGDENATSSCDSSFVLRIWSIAQPEKIHTIDMKGVDILYLRWLFEDVVSEMTGLKGIKKNV